jgi:hypothetical protein
MSEDESDPFADLGSGATDDDRDPFAELDAEADDESAFESVDVDPVAAEDVWASLDEDATDPEVSLGGDAESVGADEHRVPKGDYCERCPYFADPPEVACTHEGTTIVAVEDADHFRVRGCPMVEGSPPGGDR